MNVRCSACKGSGHVRGHRTCPTCHGAGAIQRTLEAPQPEHGTIAAYDGGCRCAACVRMNARTAADTPLGRELGLGEPLPDAPDDQGLPRWMVSMHENCGNGPSVDRLSNGVYRATWPCGIVSDIMALPFSSLRDPGWERFHDLAIADAEHRRNTLAGTAPAKGVQVR